VRGGQAATHTDGGRARGRMPNRAHPAYRRDHGEITSTPPRFRREFRTCALQRAWRTQSGMYETATAGPRKKAAVARLVSCSRIPYVSKSKSSSPHPARVSRTRPYLRPWAVWGRDGRGRVPNGFSRQAAGGARHDTRIITTPLRHPSQSVHQPPLNYAQSPGD
jgi:hypothetical protein